MEQKNQCGEVAAECKVETFVNGNVMTVSEKTASFIRLYQEADRFITQVTDTYERVYNDVVEMKAEDCDRFSNSVCEAMDDVRKLLFEVVTDNIMANLQIRDTKEI